MNGLRFKGQITITLRLPVSPRCPY